MLQMALAHVSWAIADNADRPPCDAFFLDVFGAETAFEMLETPDTAGMGLDREERLMLIGDTMLIPIAPAGAGETPGSPLGDMLRRSAQPGRWIGVALRVASLPAADIAFRSAGLKPATDPGMENSYFLINRRQLMGMRIEVLGQDLPGDGRTADSGWSAARWRDDHPLGIEGLQAVAISAHTVVDARELFADRLGWREIGERPIAHDHARCAAFLMGDTVLEAMEPLDWETPLGRHLDQIGGICSVTFKVRDAAAAADYLRGRGFTLIGDPADRFAIAPEEAFGRTIWLSEVVPAGYPQAGSRLHDVARLAREASR